MVFPTALNPRISTFTTTVTPTAMLTAVSSNCFCPRATTLVSPLSRQRSPLCRMTSSCVFKSNFDASGSDSLPLSEFLKDVDALSLLKEAAQARPPPLFWRDSERMETIYQNYRDAIYQSGDPSVQDIVMYNTARVFDLISMHLKDPFELSSYHKAIRAPFDYYEFGLKYFCPLIDFENSYVGNISMFQEILEKLQKGENVFLMSNHQAEVDPVFIALLLESTHPYISENMTYFMNRGIPKNPFYKIFSMGRNLIHYHLPEAEKGANQRINIDETVSLLRGGSQIIWIAPSGGMDCLDPVTQELFPAQFDSSLVVMMRELVERSGIPSHVYPLALLSTDKMSLPIQVEKDVEKRIISFHGVGLTVGPIINFHEASASFDDPNEVERAYAQTLYDSVSYQYKVLKSAIHEKHGLEASTHTVSLSQPFISRPSNLST